MQKTLPLFLASVVLLGIAGCSAGPSEPAQTPKAESVATATPEPAYTVESVSIGADLLADQDAFMEIYLDGRISDWLNAGATQKNAEAFREAGLPLSEDFAVPAAAQYDPIFIEALFIPTWNDGTHPDLEQLVAKLTEAHKDTLQLYLATSFPDIIPENLEAYRRVTNYDSIVSWVVNADGSVTVQNAEHDSDNKDKNVVGEKTGATGASGEIATPTRTFVVVDGTVRLSNIVFG